MLCINDLPWIWLCFWARIGGPDTESVLIAGFFFIWTSVTSTKNPSSVSSSPVSESIWFYKDMYILTSPYDDGVWAFTCKIWLLRSRGPIIDWQFSNWFLFNTFFRFWFGRKHFKLIEVVDVSLSDEIKKVPSSFIVTAVKCMFPTWRLIFRTKD